ncbi:MAG: hypothetical protein ABJB17_04125, partial [Burkholderiales bacterium]
MLIFLKQDHVDAGFGQQCRLGGARGTPTDDEHLAGIVQRAGKRLGRDRATAGSRLEIKHRLRKSQHGRTTRMHRSKWAARLDFHDVG